MMPEQLPEEALSGTGRSHGRLQALSRFGKQLLIEAGFLISLKYLMFLPRNSDLSAVHSTLRRRLRDSRAGRLSTEHRSSSCSFHGRGRGSTAGLGALGWSVLRRPARPSVDLSVSVPPCRGPCGAALPTFPHPLLNRKKKALAELGPQSLAQASTNGCG